MKFINGFWLTTKPLILITESDISESDVSEADRFIENGIFYSPYYWANFWNATEIRSEVAWYAHNCYVKTKTNENKQLLERKSYNKKHATSDIIFVVFLNVDPIVNCGL